MTTVQSIHLGPSLQTDHNEYDDLQHKYDDLQQQYGDLKDFVADMRQTLTAHAEVNAKVSRQLKEVMARNDEMNEANKKENDQIKSNIRDVQIHLQNLENDKGTILLGSDPGAFGNCLRIF